MASLTGLVSDTVGAVEAVPTTMFKDAPWVEEEASGLALSVNWPDLRPVISFGSVTDCCPEGTTLTKLFKPTASRSPAVGTKKNGKSTGVVAERLTVRLDFPPSVGFEFTLSEARVRPLKLPEAEAVP